MLESAAMGSVWQDLRYALRTMAKAPGLTAVLAFTLALGIGASTTIFSVVNSVVLKPLPFRQPDQLVRVYSEFHGIQELDHFPLSPPEFQDLRRDCRGCASVGAYSRGTAAIAGGDRPVRVDAGYLTHDVLPTLGVQPLLGRWFDASEDRPGDQTVILLSHGVWQRAFGGDPNIIGRKITSDAMPVTVIGVMPKGFELTGHEEAWLPFCFDFTQTRRGNHQFSVVARLRDGVTPAQLQEELVALTSGWMLQRKSPQDHSLSNINPYLPNTHPLVVAPFHADLLRSLAPMLWLLQGAVLFVLLIAIVNVANLLLARSETRTREVAVRHALGASRGRLVRQFVTESLVLGILGGGLGVLVAVWAVDGISALVPKSVPRGSEIALDAKAVAFAVTCSLGAALLFGLAPIMHARRTDLHGALKDGSNRMTGSRARLRVRRALVITEIALAVVLVIGCTVMVRTFVRLQRIDPGFDPDRVLTFEVEIPLKTYPDLTGDVFWRRLLDRLRAIPGVKAVAFVDALPSHRLLNANDFEIPGRTPPTPGTGLPVWNMDLFNVLSDGAITALGSRIVKGRDILPTDTLEAPEVLLVNERFANRFFPGEDPIGQRIRFGANADGPAPTIVGVVADMRQLELDRPAGTEVYVPIFQVGKLNDPRRSMIIMTAVMRTERAPLESAAAATRALADIDPSIPIANIRTMDDVMWEAVSRPRFLTILLTAFAAIALLLAAVGIYGVMAHTVAQRTHEIGLRVALGARPSQVRAMVLRQASGLVAIGVAVGLAAVIGVQLALGATLRGVFHGAALSQPVLLVAVALAVVATALLATWIPVRRALRVEPTVALRSE